MDNSRLANVIFDRGQKITQSHYQQICESIADDTFTLDEYVLDYKLKERFIGKVPYRLQDGSNVLVSENLIRKLNSIDIDKQQLSDFMRKSCDNFKKILSILI